MIDYDTMTVTEAYALTEDEMATLVPWTTAKDADGDTVHTTPDGFTVTRTGRTLYVNTAPESEARAMIGGRLALRTTDTLSGARRIIVNARRGEYRHG